MPISNQMESKSASELIRENQEKIAQLELSVAKINKYIKWQRIFLVIKILFIVLPLVIGLIYLPTLLKNIFTPYQDLLGDGGTASSLENFDVNSIKSLMNDLAK